jgi:hypothetical protein
MVIYCHSIVITKIILLYNTEWRYDHGMAVNYCSKKFYDIGNRVKVCDCDKHPAFLLFQKSFQDIVSIFNIQSHPRLFLSRASGYNTVVEHSTPDGEIEGLNPASSR